MEWEIMAILTSSLHAKQSTLKAIGSRQAKCYFIGQQKRPAASLSWPY